MSVKQPMLLPVVLEDWEYEIQTRRDLDSDTGESVFYPILNFSPRKGEYLVIWSEDAQKGNC